MYVCLVLRIIILIRNMIKNALFFINWIGRKIALKLYSIIEYNYLPKDFVSSSGHTKIKFARSLAFKILLLRFIRIYQRKRYRTDFSANTSVHRTLETFTVKILNHAGAPRQTGTKMAAVAEERTSRSLGDCVMAARAGAPRERWMSCKTCVPSLVSFYIVTSSHLSSLFPCGTPLFPTSSLFFSRGLVFILAYHGDDECQPR